MDIQTILSIIVVIGVILLFGLLQSGNETSSSSQSKQRELSKEDWIYYEIQQKQREIEEAIVREEHKTKVSILMKLKMNHLKTICAAESLDCPRTRRKDELANYLAERLDLDEVKNWAWRYKTASKDEIKAFREVEKALWKEFEEFKAEKLKELNINVEDSEDDYSFDYGELEEQSYGEDEVPGEPDILDILEDFHPETVRDEEDLEKQLYQFLRARLGSNVRRQYQVGDQKIDIAVGDSVGIEIKIAENRSKLQRLVGQVLDYVEHFDEVIAVILDVGANVDIDNYIKKLRQLGTEVVVLEGNIKRKGRSREIIIKDARRKIIIR
ncbi:hypothetical protein [Thermococcus camini]|uniref:Uncharacterized protein n=1 Tax=Thermococcus camini TaxID=2016373 RepID=A0A7G2DBQ6_9EURY|nr:hypothetical protein [Thermococcus camini]CAD5244579.1 conserved protein of unknown function [Thermococcus camini]